MIIYDLTINMYNREGYKGALFLRDISLGRCFSKIRVTSFVFSIFISFIVACLRVSEVHLEHALRFHVRSRGLLDFGLQREGRYSAVESVAVLAFHSERTPE